MKKLIVCVGLAAVGTSTLHAQFNPGLSAAELAQPWTVAATLRGFYDDNYLTQHKPNDRSSSGFEISPQASFSYAPEQTSLSVSYVYDLKYFDDRETTDQSHIFKANLNHTFSEQYAMHAGEVFIYSKEPTVLSPGLVASPLRTTGDNIHNDASIGGSAEISKTLTLKASYDNNLYAYQQLVGDVPNQTPIPSLPSLSALLDRIDQLATIEGDWQATDNLSGLLGYQYENVQYTSPEAIIYGAAPVFSKQRNNESHFFFVGADDKFTDQLSGSIRAGGQYIEYDNAPTHVSATDPYVDANLTWQYMASSSLTLGAKHMHNATDVIGIAAANGNPVLDTSATAGYATLTQNIAGALTGSLLGQFQHSEFNGGNLDGKGENFIIAGVNLNYRFSPYLSAEAGYNFNDLISDVGGRNYSRNQVYIGVKGEY